MLGLDAWELPRLFAAASMLVLSVWITFQAIDWPIGRLFALYFLLRGTLNVILPFANEEGWFLPPSVFENYATYLNIAIPAVAVALALRLVARAKRQTLPPSLMPLLVSTTLALMLIFTWNHDAFGTVRSKAVFRTYSGLGHLMAGHLLLRHGRHERNQWIGTALILFPLFAAATDMLVGFNRHIYPGGYGNYRGIPIDLLESVANSLLLAWGLWLASSAPPRHRAVMYVAALGSVPAFVHYLANNVVVNESNLAFNGFTTLATPIIIGVAVIRETSMRMQTAWGVGKLTTGIAAAILFLGVGLWAQASNSTPIMILSGLLTLAVLAVLIVQGGKLEVAPSHSAP